MQRGLQVASQPVERSLGVLETPEIHYAFTPCSISELSCVLAVMDTRENRIASILSDKENPCSWRDCCIKAAKAGDLRNHPQRLRAPMRLALTAAIRVSSGLPGSPSPQR